MDRDKLIERLAATFLEELDEHVRVFNRELLALEQQPTEPWAERIQTLFRAAHSLKGAARAVSAVRVEAICHRLEEVLAAVRDGHSSPSRELFELLFAAADAIDHAGKLFAGQGGPDDEAVVNALIARLNTAHNSNGKRLPSVTARADVSSGRTSHASACSIRHDRSTKAGISMLLDVPYYAGDG